MEKLSRKDLPAPVRATYDIIEDLLKDLLGESVSIVPYLSRALVLDIKEPPLMLVMEGPSEYRILFYPVLVGYFRTGEDSWNEFNEIRLVNRYIPLWIRKKFTPSRSLSILVRPLYYNGKRIGDALIVKERGTKEGDYIYILGPTIWNLYFVAECHLSKSTQIWWNAVLIDKIFIGIPPKPFLKIFFSLVRPHGPRT